MQCCVQLQVHACSSHCAGTGIYPRLKSSYCMNETQATLGREVFFMPINDAVLYRNTDRQEGPPKRRDWQYFKPFESGSWLAIERCA